MLQQYVCGTKHHNVVKCGSFISRLCSLSNTHLDTSATAININISGHIFLTVTRRRLQFQPQTFGIWSATLLWRLSRTYVSHVSRRIYLFSKECTLRVSGAAPGLTAMASSRCLYLSASSILVPVKQDRVKSQRSQVKQALRSQLLPSHSWYSQCTANLRRLTHFSTTSKYTRI